MEPKQSVWNLFPFRFRYVWFAFYRKWAEDDLRLTTKLSASEMEDGFIFL